MNWQNVHADQTCTSSQNFRQVCLIFPRGWRRQLYVANVLMEFPRRTRFVQSDMYFSAEVNIGILAACVPTLLPLYRLIRDKIINVRRNSLSGPGRFTRFFTGRTSSKSVPVSTDPLWKSRSAKVPPYPADQTSPWDHRFVFHPYTKFQRLEVGDIEMQSGVSKEILPEVPRSWLK